MWMDSTVYHKPTCIYLPFAEVPVFPMLHLLQSIQFVVYKATRFLFFIVIKEECVLNFCLRLFN